MSYSVLGPGLIDIYFIRSCPPLFFINAYCGSFQWLASGKLSRVLPTEFFTPRITQGVRVRPSLSGDNFSGASMHITTICFLHQDFHTKVFSIFLSLFLSSDEWIFESPQKVRAFPRHAFKFLRVGDGVATKQKGQVTKKRSAGNSAVHGALHFFPHWKGS